MRIYNNHLPFPALRTHLLHIGLLLICGLWTGTTATAAAPLQEFTKKLNRTFSTNATGMTALYNKYGQVKVQTWADNSVKMDITITVNANSQREADEMFRQIQVNFTSTSGYVKAETMIGQTSWWTPKCDNFKIDYEVMMPIGNQLDLKNRYGNSFVGNLNGKLLAEIKYGDLRTENVRADAELYLSYGKAFISSVQNLSGQISYGELRLNDCKDVQMDTKYSDINIERANDVRITSKYDDFDLGDMNDLRLQTKYADVKVKALRSAYVTAQYSDLKVGSVSESLDAGQTYGSLRLDQLSKNFRSVNLDGKYTDYKVSLERNTPCRFDIEYKNADVKLPPAATVRLEESNGMRVKSGYIDGNNNRANLNVKLQYGGFVLVSDK
jgi:hypothetical protein